MVLLTFLLGLTLGILLTMKHYETRIENAEYLKDAWKNLYETMIDDADKIDGEE